MNKLKKIFLDLWEDKYLFILCFIVAFLCWQGINEALLNDYKEKTKISSDN
tara:strand:+ start:335 stop:487 length:153 start_codon:yes stop_codon:yes gene_type:complete